MKRARRTIAEPQRDHKREVDRIRKRRHDLRRRDGKNQRRQYPQWLTVDEVAEIIADAKRIENPTNAVVEDLEKIDVPSISYFEYHQCASSLQTCLQPLADPSTGVAQASGGELSRARRRLALRGITLRL